MRWLLALLLSALWHSASVADTSVAVGVDVWKDRGTFAELRYTGQRWRHWSTSLGTIDSAPRVSGELYQTWFGDRLTTGLGLTYSKADEIVGTRLRYSLRFEWRLRSGYSLGLLHESNCRTVCDNSLMRWATPGGAEKGPNWGYDLVYLRITLR